MKRKILGLLLAAFVVIALVGCGKKEPAKVELTDKNFNDYIILNVQFDDADSKSRVGILGPEYKGTATIKATAKLKKDVTVEDVIIEGKVAPSGMLWSGNEYTFKLELDKDGEAEYSKDIDTGDYTVMLKPDEQPILCKYSSSLEDGQFLINDDKVVVTSLSGSVYIQED